MNTWNEYYDEFTIKDLFGNLYGQKEFANELVSLPRASKILEVGTGSGTFSILLSWLGFSITSIDLDPKVIEQAEANAEKFNAKITFQIADTFKLPFPNDSFDVIFHQGLLEHFNNEDIRRILNEQLRVAKRVIFSVPNNLYPRRDFGNERLMDKSTWENILSQYKILKSQNYSPKRFPKFYIYRGNIQYMAVIEQSSS